MIRGLLLIAGWINNPVVYLTCFGITKRLPYYYDMAALLEKEART